MSEWMEYLYMQKPKPTNATGVPIQITVTDQTNITSIIATTTSTADGKFSILWTAPDEGKYTITATFLGSNSYYASHDSSALAISATSPQPTSTTTSTLQLTQPKHHQPLHQPLHQPSHQNQTALPKQKHS